MTRDWRKLLLAAFLAVLVVCFFVFDLGAYLSLSYVKNSLESLKAAYHNSPWISVGIFSLLYLGLVASNLPGSVVLGLSAGAIFGLGLGTVLVSLLSTLGATLACAVSRYLLRDWVRLRFAKAVRVMDRGVETEGAFFLFGLRLVPAVPFFLINLTMGLTKMPLARFALISWLGMFPGTVVIVNAGREIGQMNALSDLFSPELIVSLLLLAVLPLAGKMFLSWLRKVRTA